MSFLSKLAEGLRSREKSLEDHNDHPTFEADHNDVLKSEFDTLRDEVKAFREKVEKAQNSGEDYDEHFEKKIEDEHQKLSIKIDAWGEKLK